MQCWNIRTLFCFSSIINKSIDTVHLIEGLNQPQSREWEESNRLIDFKWAVIRKKTREIKDAGQRYKL